MVVNETKTLVWINMTTATKTKERNEQWKRCSTWSLHVQQGHRLYATKVKTPLTESFSSKTKTVKRSCSMCCSGRIVRSDNQQDGHSSTSTTFSWMMSNSTICVVSQEWLWRCHVFQFWFEGMRLHSMSRLSIPDHACRFVFVASPRMRFGITSLSSERWRCPCYVNDRFTRVQTNENDVCFGVWGWGWGRRFRT